MSVQQAQHGEEAPPVAMAREFLSKHSCITLATTGPDGPWAATVFYANRGFDLYFLSGANTRHVRNLDTNPRVAGTINDDAEDWRSIRGVQLEGVAEDVNASRRSEVLRMFTLRFPFPEMFWWSEDGTVPRAEQRIVRIRPKRLLFCDHRFSKRRLEVPSELLLPE